MIVAANAARLPLPDASVHCIVTSPPYWGLRTYDGEHQAQVWGGTQRCPHAFSAGTSRCGCGAWLGQLGSEPTPAMYLGNMMQVFREQWRVLRDDGTLWVNMGDAHYTKAHGAGPSHDPKYPGGRDRSEGRGNCNRARGGVHKQMVCMPWRFALAMVDDGWLLRRDIIWAKRNPIPESVLDRPTTAHEYIFLFSKRQRYFYDRYAVREATTGTAHARGTGVNPKARAAGPNSRIYKDRDPAHQTAAQFRSRQNRSFSAAVTQPVEHRNLRSVWSFATQSYRGAHFATFPERLPRTCILAATSEHGCCGHCGAPWRRVMSRVNLGDWKRSDESKGAGVAGIASPKVLLKRKAARDERDAGRNILSNVDRHRAQGGAHDNPFPQPVHLGWEPSCRCAKGLFATSAQAIRPAIVLDPFGGSGTTAKVATELGRAGVSVDVGYHQLAARRLSEIPRK